MAKIATFIVKKLLFWVYFTENIEIGLKFHFLGLKFCVLGMRHPWKVLMLWATNLIRKNHLRDCIRPTWPCVLGLQHWMHTDLTMSLTSWTKPNLHLAHNTLVCRYYVCTSWIWMGYMGNHQIKSEKCRRKWWSEWWVISLEIFTYFSRRLPK